MVFLTNFLGYAIKKAPRKYLRSGFMDSVRIHVKGGPGGMGLPRYGGIGGRGGHIYVHTEEGCTLKKVISQSKKKRFSAMAGKDSTIKCLVGENGTDVIVKIPPGVSVYDENGILMGDLNKPDAKLKIAAGGLGGCPETNFSGQKGQAHSVVLDLKLIADVGLVGFPNAGKSTLLGSVSFAKPKVADYPFTTIRPHLGIMRYDDLRTISVADLPGLIEGAHANVGMGHKFLKHLDRTKLLLFMIDIQGFQLSPTHTRRTCLETIVLLNKEIELFKADLLRTPAMLIVNKMDTEDAQSKFEEIEPSLRNLQNAVSDFPDKFRPETVLQFDEIITTSLLKDKAESVQLIKRTIRNIIDKHYEEDCELIAERKEEELVQKIEKQYRRIAPTLA